VVLEKSLKISRKYIELSKPDLSKLVVSKLVLAWFVGLPALADPAMIKRIVPAKVNPPDPFWVGFFNILNYASGIAVVTFIVLGIIWFIKNRNILDDADEEIEGEGATSSEPEVRADSSGSEKSEPAAN